MEGDTPDYSTQDTNTRTRDLEERNKLLKERVLLLGKNLLETKEELEGEVKQIKKQNMAILKEMKAMNQAITSLSEDSRNAVKRDEMLLVERMLKDFQPLEFLRKKDIEELIKESSKK
jgi:hypothetical protein